MKPSVKAEVSDQDRDRLVVDQLLKKLRKATPAALRRAGAPAPPRPIIGTIDRPPFSTTAMRRPAPMKVSPAVATWARAMLGVLLGIALMEWPYGRSCGVLLFFYLAAVIALVVTGMWAAVFSWRGRLGAAHVVALGTILWGTVLGAYEVLPRSGYAKSSAPWWCTESSVKLDAPWVALTSQPAR